MEREPRFGEMIRLEMNDGEYKNFKVLRFGKPGSGPIYRLPLDLERPESFTASQRDGLKVVLVADDEQEEVQLFQVLLDEDDDFKIELNGIPSEYIDNVSDSFFQTKTVQTLGSDLILEMMEAQKQILEKGLLDKSRFAFNFSDLQAKLETLSLYSMINSSCNTHLDDFVVLDDYFADLNTARIETAEYYMKLDLQIINYYKLVQVQSKCKELLGKDFSVGYRLPAEYSNSSTIDSFTISRIYKKDLYNQHEPIATLYVNRSAVTVSLCINSMRQGFLDEHPEVKSMPQSKKFTLYSDEDYEKLIECIMEYDKVQQLIQEYENNRIQ